MAMRFFSFLQRNALTPIFAFLLTWFLGLVLLATLAWTVGDLLPGLGRLNQLLANSPLDPARTQPFQWVLNQLRLEVWLMAFLMCGLVAVAAGLIAHWVGVARREQATRGVADTLRDQAQDAQQKALAASQDKAKFLGMLSHELLTPLQTMLSTLSLMEGRGTVEVSDPTFTRLKESSRILHSRMSDLVDFAKLSVGRLEPRIRAFTPMRLLTMLVDDHTEALYEKGLDLHWEPAASLSTRVFSDPTRIRQILENILTNAIKYTERGGITLHAELQGEVLQVEIADSGVGISSEELAHVFDPFYRVKSSAQMAVGSGLGLAVVRSLVEMLHGRMELHSALGQGVRFRVEIPVSTLQVSDLPRLPLKQAEYPVLVVDDDPGIRHSIADAVRALGYEAVEVSNGKTALQEASQRAFYAIFCDVQLPDMNGVDVAKKIRQGCGPNQRTYIVRMSAFDASDPRAEDWFDTSLDKPLDEQHLRDALRAASHAVAPDSGRLH